MNRYYMSINQWIRSGDHKMLSHYALLMCKYLPEREALEVRGPRNEDLITAVSSTCRT